MRTTDNILLAYPSMGLLITVSLQPFPSVSLMGPWFDLLYLAPDLMAYPIDNR